MSEVEPLSPSVCNGELPHSAGAGSSSTMKQESPITTIRPNNGAAPPSPLSLHLQGTSPRPEDRKENARRILSGNTAFPDDFDDKSTTSSLDPAEEQLFAVDVSRNPERAPNTNKFIDSFLEAEGKTKEELKIPGLRGKALRLVTTPRFNGAAVVLIMMNTIYMGIETDWNVGDESVFNAWFAIDLLFTVCFTMELGLRFYAFGVTEFLRDRFNVFDTLLIAVSVFDTMVIVVNAAQGNTNSSGLEFVIALRITRLLRVVRTLRVIRFFKSLFLLVSGVLQSGRAVLWAWALILLLVYIAGILITRMVGQPFKDDPVIDMYFGTLPKSMFSLFEVITTEGWNIMMRRAMLHMPSVWIFFVLFISITSFGLMNVLTAVIVENTLDMARKNQKDIARKAEHDRRKALKNIYHVFSLADEDGDKQLTKEEFLKALNRSDVVRALYDVDIDMGDAESLFDILDYDQSGFLDATEFIQGCLSARGCAKARDVLATQCDLWRTQTRMQGLLSTSLTSWTQECDELSKDFAEMRRVLSQSDERGGEEMSDEISSPRSPNSQKRVKRKGIVLPPGFSSKTGEDKKKPGSEEARPGSPGDTPAPHQVRECRRAPTQVLGAKRPSKELKSAKTK